MLNPQEGEGNGLILGGDQRTWSCWGSHSSKDSCQSVQQGHEEHKLEPIASQSVFLISLLRNLFRLFFPPDPSCKILLLKCIVSQLSCSVLSNSLWPHGLQHARLPCPSPTPGSCSNSWPSHQWCHPTISSSVSPLSFCPQSFPVSGSFPVSQFFESGGQSIGASASASVLPMNIQDWSPLGWTGWISLQSSAYVLHNCICFQIRSFLHPLVAVVQPLSHVWLFVTPWTAAHQACMSFTISWSLLELMSTESVMPSNHLILCRPLLLLPSILPSIRVFSNESTLHIRWPKYWTP